MKNLFLTIICLLGLYLPKAETVTLKDGIAIQGILRDNAGIALKNETAKFEFIVYYDRDNQKNIKQTGEIELTTDGFGVFSYVLALSEESARKMIENKAFLKILKDNTVISDEALKSVPYAYVSKVAEVSKKSDDGVPTGAIMPFVGSNIPEGWVLCDGREIPNDKGQGENLKKVLGNATHTPDLRGYFLRGAETNDKNKRYKGPSIRETQDDEIKSHKHGDGNLKADKAGAHKHKMILKYEESQKGDEGSLFEYVKGDNLSSSDYDGIGNEYNEEAGAHTHEISGETSETGGDETRPANYGVNYIIKL
jgi:hypothetical protein